MSILSQTGFVIAFGLGGEIIASWLPFPIPASVIGLLLLLAAVKGGLLSEMNIRPVADILTQNMAFLFIPSAVNIMQSYPRIRTVIFPLLLVCILSTVITFAVAYFVARFIQLRQAARYQRAK